MDDHISDCYFQFDMYFPRHDHSKCRDLPFLEELTMEVWFNSHICYELLSNGQNFIDWLLDDIILEEKEWLFEYV